MEEFDVSCGVRPCYDICREAAIEAGFDLAVEEDRIRWCTPDECGKCRNS